MLERGVFIVRVLEHPVERRFIDGFVEAVRLKENEGAGLSANDWLRIGEVEVIQRLKRAIAIALQRR